MRGWVSGHLSVQSHLGGYDWTGMRGVIVWATGSSPRGTAQSVGGVTLRLRLRLLDLDLDGEKVGGSTVIMMSCEA